MTPGFCGPFDRALAERGVPAVFLLDQEGLLRFDPDWTRDAWQRAGAGAELRPGWVWVLARDRDSGYVLRVLVTSPDLLLNHPRLDVRHFPDHEAAAAALAELGRPPIRKTPW